MNIVTSEFRELIERLVSNLQSSDCPDAEEYRLAQEYHALPLGFDLWSRVFLTSDGEIIWIGSEPEEITRATDTQSLIRVIVSSTGRYPEFAALISARPNDAVACPACNGTKMSGKDILNGKLGRCVICAGLGWVVGDA
jgi:hypothetical protein